MHTFCASLLVLYIILVKSDCLVRIRVMHTCSVTLSSVLYDGFIDRLANLYSVSLRYLDTLPPDGHTPSIGFSEQ